jgi:hypothetical protein
MFHPRAMDDVLLENLETQSTIFELADDKDDLETVPVPEAAGFTHVHLAMSATWHLPKNPQDRVELTSEAEAFAWIENCVSYLKKQLTALC